jgi:hypothetical protein
VYQWLSTWLQRATFEREMIEERRSQKTLECEDDSLLTFALSVCAGLKEELFDDAGIPLPIDLPGLPDRSEGLGLLLESTRAWLVERPELLRQAQSEAQELTKLLAWVRS